MVNYLWELNFETIPLGWQETYEHALVHCPNGEIVAMRDISYQNDSISRHFFDPVGYRNKLLLLFEKEQSKAHEILKSETDFKPLFNQLLKMDIRLYNLLQEWLLTDDCFDGSSFDPRTIEESLDNTYEYFNDRFDSSFNSNVMKAVMDLRLVNLTE